MNTQKPQVTKKQIVDLLDEIHHLMTLRGENPFKLRAFEKASQFFNDPKSSLSDSELLTRAEAKTLTDLPGIGKGISEVLTEFILSGESSILSELKKSLPHGLLELTEIPGLGPKRAMQLIETLEVHSVAELEYACRENRLLKIKGFGEKAQNKIIEGIQLLKAHAGQIRISDAIPAAEKVKKLILAGLQNHVKDGNCRVSEVGAVRRRMEVVNGLEFLIELPKKNAETIKADLEQAAENLQKAEKLQVPIRLHFSTAENYGYNLAHLTASPEHWQLLPRVESGRNSQTEEEFYEKLGLPWISPEMRETGEEIELAQKGKLSDVLSWQGIQGVFHNHTTRSDGSASLEEMVVAARDLGYKYIGISDHSQSAFYAQGLKGEDLLTQEREIHEVQEKYPDIKIFWGIESDILADGSLDYDEKILKRFDFVIASIHSRFQMDKEAMTDRILEAIRNPYTRFLGHATGRLLLGRKGYDMHMERIIEEAAKRDVAIEINSNPARLDIDWRWGAKLREYQTVVSVNPDAHDTDGLKDVHFGVAVARKALLSQGLVVNARSVNDVEKWLKRA